jgi:hypothetical protein
MEQQERGTVCRALCVAQGDLSDLNRLLHDLRLGEFGVPGISIARISIARISVARISVARISVARISIAPVCMGAGAQYTRR